MEIKESVSVRELERDSRVDWGAIWAGFVVVLALAWLLHLFGLALGVSVLDMSDGAALGDGFGVGAALWMMVSALVAFFVGGLLVARLAATADPDSAMQNSLALWGVVTVGLLLMGTWGLTGLLETGQQGVRAIASGASSVAGEMSRAATTAIAAADSEFGDELRATVRASAAEVVAGSVDRHAENVDVRQAEVRRAIESLEQDDLRAIATHVVRGETEAARSALADRTGLERREVDAIVESLVARAEATTRDSERIQRVIDRLETSYQEASRALARAAGPGVSAPELRRSLAQLDADTLAVVASRLIDGRPESAKNVLAARTDLYEQEIDAIIEGVWRESKARVEEWRAAANREVEAISDYAQAVLWTAFLALAAGMAASIGGGWLGAKGVEGRLEVAASTQVSTR